MKKFLIGLFACLLLLVSSCKENYVRYDTSLIPVRSGEKWGYINPKGEFVINPQFDSADFFYDGIAMVKQGDNYGYINDKGEFIINPQYKQATSFEQGIAFTVKNNEKIKSIDKKGNVLNTFDFDMVLVTAENIDFCDTGDDKVSVINNDGKVFNKDLLNGEKYLFNGFGSGLISIAVKNDNNRKFGYMDLEGKMVINPQFDSATPFVGDKACVKANDSWGVIDKSGKYVINPQFESIEIASDDMYAVRVKGGDKWGFCDKNGKLIINPQFESVGSFGQYDLAPAEINGSWGFIDKSGKIVINPQFESASPFIDGYAVVNVGDKYGLIDKEGKYLVNPQFDDLAWSINQIWVGGVQSDYFDINSIVSGIQKVITANSIGGVGFSDNAAQIIAKFPEITTSKLIYSYGTVPVAEGKFNKFAPYTVNIGGNFSTEVPDGYFSKTILNERAVPSTYTLNINLEGKALEKKDDIYNALLAKYKKGESQLLSISGKMWDCTNGYGSISLTYNSTGITADPNEIVSVDTDMDTIGI